MTNQAEHDRREQELITTVGEKETRKLRARATQRSVWFGLGMFGMVGWSVAVPMLALLALGIWIDRRWPSPYSWTLMLLFVGIVLGCLNAWYWIAKQRRIIEGGDNNSYTASHRGGAEGHREENGAREAEGNND